MARIRLQHVGVTFPPGRADAVRAFYAGVLRLDEMPVPEEVADQGWVWFATRDEGIELHFIPSEIPPDPARRHHFCLEVDDLEAVRRRVRGAGAEAFDAGSAIRGRPRFFTHDPLGNLVEILEMRAD